jgi:hypothetical protein
VPLAHLAGHGSLPAHCTPYGRHEWLAGYKTALEELAILR